MVGLQSIFDTVSWTVWAWLTSVTDRHYRSKCRASSRRAVKSPSMPLQWLQNKNVKWYEIPWNQSGSQ